jgi:phage tail sheath protein FI
VEIPGKFPHSLLWDNLTVSSDSSRQRDNIIQVFASNIRNRLQELETPLELDADNLQDAQLAGYLIGLTDWQTKLNPPDPPPNPSSSPSDKFTIKQRFNLTGGSDGKYPAHKTYEGDEDISTGIKSGLKSCEDLEDISIIAAPGYSHSSRNQEDVKQISQYLMSHCENMRYRVAILDSPDSQAVSGVRQYKALLDSTRVALYYPWVRILDPITNQQINVPPSGFVAGIYARNDVEIGVHKAPANEVVRGAIGLETTINKAQQDVLNPLGINCIRFFENRGIRVWGARTASSDPEWKYLNIRRYFAYLERSIERSTQWAVFEPNGDQLWANVRRSVESFLENEWKEGRLFGAKVEQAFFVRCDRSTMTQNDIDNGRMICLIGVAPLYPAEFVIFRIGQWTANARR